MVRVAAVMVVVVLMGVRFLAMVAQALAVISDDDDDGAIEDVVDAHASDAAARNVTLHVLTTGMGFEVK